MMIPKDFYKLHHFVTLTADIMYVNGVAFLTTLSRKISLRTAVQDIDNTVDVLT